MPSSQTLFLHIGTEKTGTTTLQTMYSDNRKALADAGLLYPRTPGFVNHVGAALYALDLEDRPDLRSSLGLTNGSELIAYRDRFIGDLCSEVAQSGCPAVLISNEHLSSRVTQPAQIERLVQGLSTITSDIRVIVYLRPQYELAPSWFSTSIKSGNTEPFKPPASDGNYFYNYDKLLRNWEQAVSRANIAVRLFAKSSFVNGNLVDDFFSVLGRPRPGNLTIPADKNKSLDAGTLEFLRIANKHVPWFVDGAQNSCRPALLQDIEAISGSGGAVADPAMLGRLDSLFRDSNRKVAERYFPDRLDLFPVFSPRQIDGEGDGVLTAARAVEIAIELWRRRLDKGQDARRG